MPDDAQDRRKEHERHLEEMATWPVWTAGLRDYAKSAIAAMVAINFVAAIAVILKFPDLGADGQFSGPALSAVRHWLAGLAIGSGGWLAAYMSYWGTWSVYVRETKGHSTRFYRYFAALVMFLGVLFVLVSLFQFLRGAFVLVEAYALALGQ